MTPSRCLPDTNVLLLLIAGRVSERAVLTHKRLRAFGSADVPLLSSHISGRPLVTTPNVVTEVSNLLVQGVTGTMRQALLATLRAFVQGEAEIYVPSGNAVAHPAFAWLGVTDCVLLEACWQADELVTVDAGLYSAALGHRLAVTNFNHIRERAGTI